MVISVFDIHFKLFDSSIGDDRFTTTVYEKRTSPEHAPILKNALYKAIHPYNHSAIQFIPNGIQGMTNKDVYWTIIKKTRSWTINPLYLSTISNKKI